MLRFFRSNKDKNKQQQNQAEQQPKDKQKQAHPAGEQGSLRALVHAATSTATAPAVTASPDAAPPAVPVKQVAFGAVENVSLPPPPDDVQSLISHHGILNNVNIATACFPSQTRSNNAAQASKQHQIPSQPVRQIHADYSYNNGLNKDATIRRAAPTSPTARGDIPDFRQDTDVAMRSGTSMSQNTTASSSSFSSQHRSGSNFYANQAANYPNLAILATYSKDMNAAGGGNGIMQHLTWSEITDEELVENLGGRERTRQEVLFEMVCSEERYVQELLTLKECYLDPLLGRQQSVPTSPIETMRSASSTSRILPAVKSTESLEARRSPLLNLSVNSARAVPAGTMKSGHLSPHNLGTMGASSENLPIAARFARRVSLDAGPGLSASVTSITSPSGSSDGHTAEGYRGQGKNRDASGGTGISGTTAVDSAEEGDSSFSHAPRDYPTTRHRGITPIYTHTNNSRPQVSPSAPNSSSTHVGTLHIPKAFRHHLKNLSPPPPNKLHKPGDLSQELPLIIPEDLMLICRSITNQLLTGHQALSARLRARYEEQFPLVRSLADVFAEQGWVIESYTTYVLHLEKALQDIEEILQTVNPLLAAKVKKTRSKEELKEQRRLAKAIMRLEEQASVRGHPGLSICLSQPFQRLLKYPLLFQSLLYHTDPSTRDYDATQKLAFEIDAVVRSIENEKVSDEERAKTRDCWARIEGLNDRTLTTPRADRLLVSEEAMWSLTIPGMAAARRTFSDAGRNLKSIEEVQADASNVNKTVRRLSGLVHGSGDKDGKKQPSIGSKRDVWLVAFTDVVLRCQRVGVTKLPLGSSHSAKANKRAVTLDKRERNLYRFLKIDHWVMEDQTGGKRAGAIAMEEVARRRGSARIEEDPVTESEAEAAEEPSAIRPKSSTKTAGAESTMSFSYVADVPRPTFDIDPLVGLSREPTTPTRRPGKNIRTLSPTTQQVVRKQGTAAAKFSNRVRPSMNESPASARTTTALDRSISPQHVKERSLPTRIEAGGNFSRPTAASMARAAAIANRRLEPSLPQDPKRSRAVSSGSSPPTSPPGSPQQTPRANRVRRNSFSNPPSETGKPAHTLRTKHSSDRLGHRRQGSDMNSGLALYNQFLQDDGVVRQE